MKTLGFIMNERKNLILIKGEDKTRQIKLCFYDSQVQRCKVTFINGKTYPYAYSSVRWLKNPETHDPSLYKISKGDTSFNIREIFVFRDTEEWWHLILDKGSATYRRSELQIEKSCLDEAQELDKLNYLRDIAGINELKNDDGEVLLQKQYEKLKFVGKDSALAVYLHPKSHPIQTFKVETLIFPFGGNTSQFKAVANALEKQISVIQGPPGTGKTQTILNIIANLLVQGKTVQVVSNNNSATQNILEKLSSPQYNLDFLVAALGKRENKQAFIDTQTGRYPDMSSWNKTFQELCGLTKKIKRLSNEVSYYFEKQERLAIAKQEQDALKVEAQHFTQYCEKTRLVKPQKQPRKSLKSETVLHILQECETYSEKEIPVSFWHKLKSCIFYGAFEWKFYKNDIGDILTYAQLLFYKTKSAELTEKIAQLQKDLVELDAKEKMNELTAMSMVYLKAILYNRYAKNAVRPRFEMDTIWKKPNEILREYPIVLSTTFSSRSCLKDATYDYLIMDEASQVDVATGALALASAKNAVIVGD